MSPLIDYHYYGSFKDTIHGKCDIKEWKLQHDYQCLEGDKVAIAALIANIRQEHLIVLYDLFLSIR